MDLNGIRNYGAVNQTNFHTFKQTQSENLPSFNYLKSQMSTRI